MSEWHFMDPSSRDNVLTAWREESERFLDLVREGWNQPTACALWEGRDIAGHITDTTEAYFTSFAAARGEAEAPEALGLADMARYVDEGAKSFRELSQDELVARLTDDRDRMLEMAEGLSDEEWSGGLMVPHKYMGPLPAAFYPTFQLVDYAVHSWDISQGVDRGHGLRADSADLLVPLCFILWQSTASVPAGTEPYSVGVRITSGGNAGETRADVTGEGISYEEGSVDGLPAMMEFDPASFVLTAYGRVNGGTNFGDTALADRFRDLFFRI